MQIAGRNDKIVAQEKTTWFYFRLLKTCFLFLLQTICELASCVQIPRAIGAFYHVWKWHNVQRARSETRRCTTMLTADPSYDNMTIARNLKMQIWIATNNGDVPMVMKTKFPATVMVFGVVSSEGLIMPPHIFEVGLKVNTKVYLDVLKSVVIPWCNQVADGRPWVWQQDFSHWPPSSPDLNLPDYFIWSYVENITNMTSHNTKASLIAAFHRVFAELPPTLVEKACSQFWIRIEAVIEVEGSYLNW